MAFRGLFTKRVGRIGMSLIPRILVHGFVSGVYFSSLSNAVRFRNTISNVIFPVRGLVMGFSFRVRKGYSFLSAIPVVSGCR